MTNILKIQQVEEKILSIRGKNVLLDRDLAKMYGVETRVLNQAVKRNIERFEGEDFMFQLSKNEADKLSRSQIVILNNSKNEQRGSNVKYTPYAFTELGVAMLSSVLNSKIAIEINRNIMRAFVALRQFSLNYRELADKLQEMEGKYDQQFTNITEAINYLLQKDKIEVEQKNRRRIGFIQNEE